MIYKINSLIALFILLASGLQGQVSITEPGGELKVAKTNIFLRNGGTIEGNHYLLLGGAENKERFRQAFLQRNIFGDKVLQHTYTPRLWMVGEDLRLAGGLSGADLEGGKSIIGMRVTQEKVFLLKSAQTKDGKERKIYIQGIDPGNLALRNDLKEIASISLKSKKEYGFVGMDHSPDQSHTLVLTSNMELKRLSGSEFTITVLDTDMESIWQQKITLPSSRTLLELVDFKVDNQGKVYFLTKEVDTNPSKQGSHAFAFRSYSREDKTPKVYELGEDIEESPLKFQLDFGKGGELICSGFYATKGDREERYAFYRVINAESGEVIHRSESRLSQEFLDADLTQKERKGTADDLMKYPRRNNHFRTKGLVSRSDGGAYLVGEEWKQVASSSSQYGMGASSSNYFYHSIAVVGVSPEGKLEWATKIPRRVRTDKEGGITGGSFMMISNDQLDLFYTDTEKNVNAEPEKAIKAYNTDERSYGAIVMATVTKDGSSKREIGVSGNGASVQCIPDLSRQVSANSAIICTLRGGKFKFRKVLSEN